jgi:hypothetical protein
MPALESPVSDWVHIIQAEYREMPGLTLTRKQMERLWGLDEDMCDDVLAELLARGVLVRHTDGHYALRHEPY